jgi:CHAT domain-containing protein
MAAVFADPVFEAGDSRVSGRKPHVQKLHDDALALHTALRDVEFGSARIPRLPASRLEAQAIVEALDQKNVSLALDFDAARDAVLKSDLGQYRYIHFATHGLIDSVHPEFSGLVLSLVNKNGESQDGYLRLKDIYGLKLSADMVVLSSCNSALGKDLQSEGVIGFTRAFLYAGSRRVVATLWRVDDEATAELMKHFYLRLNQGEAPASALRGAQSDLMKNLSWQHPYYWAAFVLQGEYR